MSHDHLMLTKPEFITLAVLWELSLQLSCGEQGTASREKRKERGKADSRAMPASLGEQRVPVSPQRKGNYRKFKEKVEFHYTQISTQECCSRCPILFQENHDGESTGRGKVKRWRRFSIQWHSHSGQGCPSWHQPLPAVPKGA